MKFRWLALWCAGTRILTVSSAAMAQNTRQAQTDQAPPATSQVPLYDPQQLPSQRGQVLQFTLTARGEIDGLILTDGTEVKTPAHLSTQIAYAVKPSDTVTIHGLRAAALPLVQAVSITDETTRLSVVDNDTLEPARDPGARRRPPPPLPPRANAMLGRHFRRLLSCRAAYG
jgi:hypothetical protein